jgi:MFS family permease
MADVQDISQAQGGAASSGKSNFWTLLAVIIGHVPVHLYGQGFVVMIPYLKESLGISLTQVGLIATARQAGGGIASIGGGVVTDRFQHLRGHFLGMSLVLMALGYLVAGFIPTGVTSAYVLLLLALGFATSMGSFWHPPAASVLSQRFPDRRGTVMSLHRSSGTFGDTVAGILVGALLTIVTWQAVLRGGTVVTLLIALPLWAYLWNVGGPRAITTGGQERGFRSQFRDMGRLFKNRGLITLLLVAGVRGAGDRALILFLPIYVKEALGLGPFMVGVHFSLLTALAIFTGPAIGRLSDSVGRRPVIVVVMIISAVIMALLILAQDGITFTLLVALMGTVMFSINALTQAGAMDVGEGLRLEGSIMGLYWGINAIFGAVSPPLLGVILDLVGGNLILVFWYALVAYVLGALVAMSLPSIERGARKS